MGVQLGALTPVFYAFRDREYVLNQIEAVTGGRFHPELRPHRRPEGRPAQGLDRRDQAGRWSEIRDVLRRDGRPARRQRDLPGAHPRHRRHPRATSPCPTACPAPTCGRSGVDWDLRRDQPRRRWRGTRSTGRSGPTPTATRSPATGCACRRCARRPRSSTSCSTRCPPGPIMAKVPRIIKVPEGEAWVATENPLGEMGYYVVVKGDLGPFRVKIRSASASTTSRSCRGCSRASTCPTSSRSWPASTSSSGTSTDEPARRSRSAYWAADRSCASSACCVAVLLPAGTFVYVFLFKMVSFMQSRLGPMEAGPYGSLQLFAEVGKFLQKEDIVPDGADQRLFKLAPVSSSWSRCSSSTSWCPFGPDAALRRPRRRHLLRARRVVDLGARHARWPAGRRPTSTR